MEIENDEKAPFLDRKKDKKQKSKSSKSRSRSRSLSKERENDKVAYGDVSIYPLEIQVMASTTETLTNLSQYYTIYEVRWALLRKFQVPINILVYTKTPKNEIV